METSTSANAGFVGSPPTGPKATREVHSPGKKSASGSLPRCHPVSVCSSPAGAEMQLAAPVDSAVPACSRGRIDKSSTSCTCNNYILYSIHHSVIILNSTLQIIIPAFHMIDRFHSFIYLILLSIKFKSADAFRVTTRLRFDMQERVNCKVLLLPLLSLLEVSSYYKWQSPFAL